MILDEALGQHTLDLCQQLIRINTVNPPGNERPAADLLAEELSAAGLEPTVLESAPGRANVVARLKGTGELPPLLLTAHLDVVEADAAHWKYPPFSGVIEEGCLWGRGAIDMKNMAAMSVALITRLAREGITPKRDLIFAGVADEEAGCAQGSLWLVDTHPELVRAEFALGEGGGFNLRLGSKNYFTVQVAEKGFCWVKATVRGEPGHGSMPREDSAIYKLSAALDRLGKQGMPRRMTAVVRDFIDALAAEQPLLVRPVLKKLLSPQWAPHVLKKLPDQGVARALLALLGNTASPTIVRAGNKANVIPGSAEVVIDGRTLPGQTSADFLRELQAVLGDEFELEIMRELPPVVTEPRRSTLYDAIMDVMAEVEPDAPVVPYMLPGFTDAKAFTQLGAKWYGFAPVKLPPGMKFAEMFHGHNERVPVDGLKWGVDVLARIVGRSAGFEVG